MHAKHGYWVCDVIRWYNIFERISWNTTTTIAAIYDFVHRPRCVLGQRDVVQIVLRVREAEKIINDKVDSMPAVLAR